MKNKFKVYISIFCVLSIILASSAAITFADSDNLAATEGSNTPAPTQEEFLTPSPEPLEETEPEITNEPILTDEPSATGEPLNGWLGENLSEITPEPKPVKEIDEDPVYSYFKIKLDDEKTYDDIREYALFKAEFNPSWEIITNIANKLYLGGETEKIIKVYNFWITTDEDISMFESLYHSIISLEKVNAYTLEDKFNELTNNAHGVLNIEQIREYQAKGLSVEEIMVANVLSRKGVYTINEILDKKLSGSGWFEIYAYVNDNIKVRKKAEINDKKAYVNLNDAKQLQIAFELFQYGGKDINKYLKLLVKGEDIAFIRTTAINKAYHKEERLLAKQNLWKYTEDEKKAKKQERSFVEREVKKKGISAEIINEYSEEGYSDLDILNAVTISQNENKPVSEVLEEEQKEAE